MGGKGNGKITIANEAEKGGYGIFVIFGIFVVYRGREGETRIGTEYRNEIKIDV